MDCELLYLHDGKSLCSVKENHSAICIDNRYYNSCKFYGLNYRSAMDKCQSCIYQDDPCHYLCLECRNANNYEKHPGYCKHGIEICSDCVICLKEEITHLKNKINHLDKCKVPLKTKILTFK